jgi:Ni,Fe-hydrogenase III small subunit
MAEPLRRTYEAVPRPRVVVAVGDCARNCGVFAGAYGVVGPVREIVPVDAEVAGCPPRPEAIVAALRELTGRPRSGSSRRQRPAQQARRRRG